MTGNNKRRRLSEVFTAVVLAISVVTGTVLVDAERGASVKQIDVAAFNIQVFGKTKTSNPRVMEVLVRIAQEFDLMVVQEVRDLDMQTASIYLDAINGVSQHKYTKIESGRLGRSSSKEQYVVYYKPALILCLDAFVWPDPDDKFEREPLIATFRSGSFEFTLIACHVKPDDAENELRALAEVADQLLEKYGEQINILLMGDFNADGVYLKEADLANIFPPGRYNVVIGNDVVTTTKTQNTYDRIILGPGMDEEYVPNSADVFQFDSKYGITDSSLTYEVSDHYPVYASFLTTIPHDN